MHWSHKATDEDQESERNEGPKMHCVRLPNKPGFSLHIIRIRKESEEILSHRKSYVFLLSIDEY